ncbi:MAG: hypothetical protein EXS12_06635 [Phycisphaerales bacterium]|nr:hypothetical protein [Phycisphaerales bacterium]
MISKTFVAGVAVGMLIVAALATTTFQVGAASQRAHQQEMPAQLNPLIGKQDAQSTRANEGSSRGSWRGGDGVRRELSEEEIDRVIVTAREVNPQWADELVKLRQSDPKALRERLGREARKLMGLSMMKEREPDLYRVRVEDIRVQNQIRELGEAWNVAQKSGDVSSQEALMKDIELKAHKQVELDIQARGFEFVALDKSLKDARKKLQDDIRDRDKSIGDIIEAIRKGEDPKFGRRPSGMSGAIGGVGGRSRGNDNEPTSKPASINP